MSHPPGRTLPLSPARRLMCDLMHFSRQVPLVVIERRMELGELVRARRLVEPRPSWFAIFMKAYGAVALSRPELRRAYLALPRPRLFEYDRNVAVLAVERELGGERAVLFGHFRDPERQTLRDLDAAIRRCKEAPLGEVKEYRRALLVNRLPGPLRRLAWWLGLNASPAWRLRYFGTFGATGVSGRGAGLLTFLSPLTTSFCAGVIDPDGGVPVRLAFDHRVLDGALAAEVLADVEHALRGEVLTELRALEQFSRGQAWDGEPLAEPEPAAPALAPPSGR